MARKKKETPVEESQVVEPETPSEPAAEPEPPAPYDWEGEDDLDQPKRRPEAPQPKRPPTEEPVAEEEELTPDEIGLITSAEVLGMSKEFAQELSKAGLLSQALGEMGRRFAGGDVGEQGEKVREAPMPAPAVPPPADKGEPWKVSIKAEDYDEELVKALQGAHDHALTEVQQLRDQLKTVMDHLQMREHIERTREFDQRIAGLGEGWEEALGKGASLRLQKGTSQWQAREKLWNALAALEGAAARSGKGGMDGEDLFRAAFHAVFGDRIAQMERAKLAEGLKKQRGQFAARPTHRRTRDDRSAEQKAFDNLAARFEESYSEGPGAPPEPDL